jgi:superoxide dismutase, Cu-Zn family
MPTLHTDYKAGPSLVALALAALLAAPAAAQQAAPDDESQDGFAADVEEIQEEETSAEQDADAGADDTALDEAAAAGPGEEPEVLPATFVNRDGAEVGAAAIREVAAGGVLIDINVEGLPAGQWLGFHIHEEGVCDPDDDFESAGGHFNPTDAEHGYFVEGGPHAGDMPNQFVPESGLLRAEVFNPMVQFDGDNGIRGLSLIIHDEADDYESQPTGEAGGRLACAVIE